MKSGCCIVASSVGGLPELITPNIEGLLVDPTKGQELTNALRTVILNQELRVQYGKLAKLKYDKNFEKNSISKKFLSIFLI
jgi:glycosyltransferase involved in cell wall biosynthesis